MYGVAFTSYTHMCVHRLFDPKQPDAGALCSLMCVPLWCRGGIGLEQSLTREGTAPLRAGTAFWQCIWRASFPKLGAYTEWRKLHLYSFHDILHNA